MDLQRKDLGLGRKPALLLVDMVRGFTDPACPLGTNCPAVIAANQVLLAEFHQRRLPVVFTTVVYHNRDQAGIFRQRVPALDLLQPGSPWVEVDPALSFAAGDLLVEKQWASAFHRTGLHEQLQALDVDSLVVTGLTTSGCVRASVVDGLQYDYRVVVVREAVGDRNAAAHEANLHDMQAKYADVVALDSLVDMLPEGGSGG